MRGFESINREIIPRCGAQMCMPHEVCGEPAFARWKWGPIDLVVCKVHDAQLLEHSGLDQVAEHLQDWRLVT